MRLFRQEDKPKTVPSRLKRLETASLYSWLETSIMGLGATFDKVRYHDASKDEFEEHLEAINALWQEISGRVDDR